jgi:hypothetical protein
MNTMEGLHAHDGGFAEMSILHHLLFPHHRMETRELQETALPLSLMYRHCRTWHLSRAYGPKQPPMGVC